MAEAPRFRFAPSPTGAPHIGNLRTALFSWALARAMGGDFILRIEDTDPERNTPAATQAMLAALTWLGLDWDEGPDVGGAAGPYVQSERLAWHRQVADALLAGGHAYYGDDPGQTAPAAGQPLRLRLPRTGQTVLQDAIRGPITFDNARQQDPVLVRGNGRPLYHLAAMADDHAMGITHVVRGAEWIPSAPIHIQLYRAMEWPEPVWVHLPLIVDRQGHKLSKRDLAGGMRITDFQAAGYLPAALFNYLLLLGWTPDGEQEIVDRWTLRRQFRLERLSPSPSTFDRVRLNWVNRQYLARLSDADLAAAARPFLEEAYGALPDDERWLARLLSLVRGDLDRLADAVAVTAWALDELVALGAAARAALAGPSARPVLVRLAAELAAVVLLDESTADRILAGLRRDFARSHGWEAAAVLHPIRAALTGEVGGPPLPAVLGLLGRARALQRLANALK